MDFNPCPTPNTISRSKLRGVPYFGLLLVPAAYLGLDPLKGVSKERSFKFWKEVPPLTKRNSFKRNFTMLVTSLLICKEGILSNEESIATTTTIYSSSRYPRSITRRNTNVHLIGIVEAIHLFPYFILKTYYKSTTKQINLGLALCFLSNLALIWKNPWRFIYASQWNLEIPEVWSEFVHHLHHRYGMAWFFGRRLLDGWTTTCVCCLVLVDWVKIELEETKVRVTTSKIDHVKMSGDNNNDELDSALKIRRQSTIPHLARKGSHETQDPFNLSNMPQGLMCTNDDRRGTICFSSTSHFYDQLKEFQKRFVTNCDRLSVK